MTHTITIMTPAAISNHYITVISNPTIPLQRTTSHVERFYTIRRDDVHQHVSTRKISLINNVAKH